MSSYKRFYAAPTKQLLKAHNKQNSDNNDDYEDDETVKQLAEQIKNL
jgi:threonine aldolase